MSAPATHVSDHQHPDPARPDVGAALFSTWSVGTPERQRATVDAIAATWEGRPWPDRNLLSYSVYAGTDGDTLMHYSQWTSEEAYFDFVRNHRQERNDEIDTAVPGIKRVGINSYQLYRSHVPDPARRAAEAPGAIVTVDIRFDAEASGRRREWVDTVIEALTATSSPDCGLLGAHFHLLADGEAHLSSAEDRVFNYAEWTSEEVYDESFAAVAGAPSPAWEKVLEFPGFLGTTVRRYHLLRSFTPHDRQAPQQG
ncbi:antibiotic biosynthesis monooxygenase [Streptomyces sp. XD-27]|nr:antibiotic biosynthesis monooxygenase [Streptomyces sp. XD-27]WKX74432.1 antibiotic biosynthesis monooxygenase [Streptomyces sp. XD-27]